MKNQSNPNSRRKFLLTAGLGSAGAAVAVVAGRKAGTAGKAAVAEQPRGYHVTEHILKYYKTTQV